MKDELVKSSGCLCEDFDMKKCSLNEEYIEQYDQLQEKLGVAESMFCRIMSITSRKSELYKIAKQALKLIRGGSNDT